MSQPIVAKRRRTRRHRVPMPLTESGELFEGAPILREFEGELAVVLWKSYKNVTLWVGGDPAERGGLFAEGAGERRRDDLRATEIDPAIVGPLHVVAELLESPAGAAAAVVAGACRAIARWAAERGASASELLFMQAAALADPLDAEAAVTVGRLARNRAEYARAETWFRQAIVAARQTDAWGAYSRAFVGLGKVYWHRGALPAARRCLHRAYRTATRHHLRELRGWALSDLSLIAIQAGKWAEARSYMSTALRIYGPAHPLARRLVHDAAYAWIAEGWFVPAARVLAAIDPLFSDRAERMHLASSLARAGGGAGEPGLFRAGAAEVEALTADPTLAALAPDAWLDVAHGAASLGDFAHSSMAAGRALELALEHGDARVRFGAEAALEAARAGSAAATSAPAEVPVPLHALATDLLSLIEGRHEEALAGSAA